MTKAELIEAIKDCPDDMMVAINDSYMQQFSETTAAEIAEEVNISLADGRACIGNCILLWD
jgi:hypothetical protein